MTEAARNLLIISAQNRTSVPKTVLSEFHGDPFTIVTNEEFAANLKKFLRQFHHYRHAVLFTHDIQIASRIALWDALLWWIGRNRAVVDSLGRRISPTFFSLIGRDVPQIALEFARIPSLLRHVRRDLRTV